MKSKAITSSRSQKRNLNLIGPEGESLLITLLRSFASHSIKIPQNMRNQMKYHFPPHKLTANCAKQQENALRLWHTTKGPGLNLHSGCCSSMLHAVIWYSTYLDCQTTGTALLPPPPLCEPWAVRMLIFPTACERSLEMKWQACCSIFTFQWRWNVLVYYFQTSRLWSLVHLTQTITELKIER